MFEYRITKYDPSLRDESGAYTKNELISFQDVGEEFEGKIFALEEYERVETAYIQSAMSFLGEAGIKHLQIQGLENSKKSVKAINLNEVDNLSKDELKAAFRDVLREEYWCRFENEHGEYVHFGYDYYMYIGVRNYCKDAIELAVSNGLFVEEFKSPYKSGEI
jgi:hypothetical protein